MNLSHTILATLIASTKIVDGKLIPFAKLIENAQDCSVKRSKLEECIVANTRPTPIPTPRPPTRPPTTPPTKPPTPSPNLFFYLNNFLWTAPKPPSKVETFTDVDIEDVETFTDVNIEDVETFKDCIETGEGVTCQNICHKYDDCRSFGGDCSEQTIDYFNCKDPELSCEVISCLFTEKIVIDVKKLRA